MSNMSDAVGLRLPYGKPNSQFETAFEPATGTIWGYMNPEERPCFSLGLLRDIRAHDNALKQFLARNVHRTSARTGVLIFVSIAERYAEVVADAGINSKVGQHVWDGVVRELTKHAGDDRLADGFVNAIGAVGAVLAEHFPVTEGDTNELDDHLVEI